MGKLACIALVLALAACTPPKPTVPALTPETAAALLRYNAKAETWMTHVKKQNATCEYQVDLPDQRNQPTEIDVAHIVYCGGQPAPREYDASVSFSYDAQAGHWVITRFAS
jgi:hypothetical protein